MTDKRPEPRSIGNKDRSSTVERIKGIISGEQMLAYEQRLAAIETEIDQKSQRAVRLLETRLGPRQRAEDTAEILAESITIAAQSGTRLSESMNQPMEECMRSLIHKDPDHFADALFPVMGPAIRRSINETLKSFLQSMNEVIERSMSPEALKWRLESVRSGLPFSEVVLKHTLLYRVDEVFLIQQGSGLVIEYLAHPNVKPRDHDAISAMLTVIKDFVRDSFSPDPGDTLATIEFGERTLWIFEGPKALLTCVILGVAPSQSRQDFYAVLERIHDEFDDQLEGYRGDNSDLRAVHSMLEPCLQQQGRDNPRTTKKRGLFSKPLTYLFLIAIIAAIYGLWQGVRDQHRIDSLTRELQKTPGIVVTEVQKNDGKLVVSGMVDPLVTTLDQLIKRHGFSAQEIEFDLTRYQSLEPEFTVRRAARILDAPDSVEFAMEGYRLVASGSATSDWIDRATALAHRIPGIDAVDLSGIALDSASRLQRIKELLKPPDSVELELDGKRLRLVGSAPWSWIVNLRQLRHQLPGIEILEAVPATGLVADEWIRISTIRETWDGSKIFFREGVLLDSKSESQLAAIGADLVELEQLSGLLGASLEIRIQGYTDGTGLSEANRELARARAETIKAVLSERGLPSLKIKTTGMVQVASKQDFDPSQRRAELSITVGQPKSAKQ